MAGPAPFRPCLARSSATDHCWNKSCQGSGESSSAAGVSTAFASLMLRRADQRCSPSAQLLPFRAPHPLPPHPEQINSVGCWDPCLFISQHPFPAAAFPEAEAQQQNKAAVIVPTAGAPAHLKESTAIDTQLFSRTFLPKSILRFCFLLGRLQCFRDPGLQNQVTDVELIRQVPCFGWQVKEDHP